MTLLSVPIQRELALCSLQALAAEFVFARSAVAWIGPRCEYQTRAAGPALAAEAVPRRDGCTSSTTSDGCLPLMTMAARMPRVM